MSERAEQSRQWLARLNAAAARLPRPAAFMEVCGTHTVSAFRSGLHSLMPANVRLLSGPGCPVCVTSQGDIDMLIELGMRKQVTLCTYGDMIRVTGAVGSLELARSQGADIRVVYSAMDAVKLAGSQRGRPVVFAAVGFETTTPTTAAAILAAEQMGLTNFTVLASHKMIMPAMRGLLDTGRVNIDGFLLPGHVSVIVGSEIYRPIVDQYHLPCVISGFEDVQIAAGLTRLTEQMSQGQALLENLYPQAVSADGNRIAQEMVAKVFEPCDAEWRALGVLPGSGLKIRQRYALYDARVRYSLTAHASQEPAGCRCGDVITGRCEPADCKLFAKACTPIYPIGPCMVSSEGTCQAWFKYHRAGKGKARPVAQSCKAAEVTP